MNEKLLANIRKRNQDRGDSGLVGGVQEWFDIDFLLRYIDNQNELRAFIEDEIQKAELADAFIDYATGWIDGLKMILKYLDGEREK